MQEIAAGTKRLFCIKAYVKKEKRLITLIEILVT